MCIRDREEAVYAYHVIWCYTIGELIVRYNRERAQSEAKNPPRRERAMAAPEAGAFPQLARLGGRWAELATVDQHRRGLEAVVDGLLARSAD